MINNKLLEEIKQYCELNNIENIEKEVNRLLRIGFNIEKYGTSPFNINYNTNVKEIKKEQEIVEEIKHEEVLSEDKHKKRIRIIKN